jgi:hypothetical protein
MNRIGNRIGLVARRFSSGLLGLTALALGAGLLSPAWAGDAGQPARAVRLSSVDGQVRLSQGDQPLADQAVANTPLFEGTTVATAEDGRAEIQLEDGSVARLSPNSALTLSVLRGQGATGETEITLASGMGYFEIQGGGQAGTISIRFTGSVVTASGFTVLRINLDNPLGEMAVFSGNAHLERGTALAADLHGGESVTLSDADATRYDLVESIEPDSWDSWNSDRDQVLAGEVSSNTGAANGYADSGNPAWSDLDANGSWYNVPGQGNIWSPYAASSTGFDPYGSGYWMWTPRFGYIWVSGYSWGYLPFQCGAWNYYDSFGWGWAPGMSGCMPWWGNGYFGPNIGIGYGGYRPPFPPHPRPQPPIGHGPRPGAYPLVAVNRHPAASGNALPMRDRAGTVVIAGRPVQAIRPLNPRPVYDHSTSVFSNRKVYSGTGSGASMGGSSGMRTAGGQTRPAGPSFGTSRQGVAGSSSSSTAARPSGGSSNPSSPASHGYSGGGSSAGHSSGGGGYSGGGSSAGHSSGGGGFSGGGGGGASHGGGGGGSHR